MRQPFIVRRSPIHGRGAFARVPLRTGQRIGVYRGERLSAAEAERRAGNDDGHTMLFEIDGGEVIDARRHGNDARFINHACDPNCVVDIIDRQPVISARRAIAVGEELSFDYALNIDGPYRAVWTRRYRCLCGAPRCRGTMLKLRAQNRVGPMYQRLVRERRRSR